ncbi:unnamed protein product [Pleuronectes platessa]|uniref:Uncharacterized protein n=1 Tax=Pleuronectes platessa TaxID=8262 RepID=A0A9N7TZ78_PLEPL|nr:unnamed protein product [Pleuronectes platessa]
MNVIFGSGNPHWFILVYSGLVVVVVLVDVGREELEGRERTFLVSDEVQNISLFPRSLCFCACMKHLQSDFSSALLEFLGNKWAWLECKRRVFECKRFEI